MEGPEAEHHPAADQRKSRPDSRKSASDKMAPGTQHDGAGDQERQSPDADERTSQQVLAKTDPE